MTNQKKTTCGPKIRNRKALRAMEDYLIELSRDERAKYEHEHIRELFLALHDMMPWEFTADTAKLVIEANDIQNDILCRIGRRSWEMKSIAGARHQAMGRKLSDVSCEVDVCIARTQPFFETERDRLRWQAIWELSGPWSVTIKCFYFNEEDDTMLDRNKILCLYFEGDNWNCGWDDEWCSHGINLTYSFDKCFETHFSWWDLCKIRRYSYTTDEYYEI